MSGFVESVFFISIVLFIFCAIMVYLFLKPQPYSLRIIEKKLSDGKISYEVDRYCNSFRFLTLDDGFYWITLKKFNDKASANQFFELKVQERKVEELKLQEHQYQTIVKSTKVLKKG